MIVKVRNRCSDYSSYRAARVKSLFNAESGCNFDLDADLPIDDGGWSLGLVVGPSGSGKTSIGKSLFGGGALYGAAGWPDDAPIVDAIAPKGGFDAVTGALSAVGLGDVPAWLRPYKALSNGEKFRADLARIICEAPSEVVVDEFTSVVDRQIARFGAMAFSKAWKRTGGKCVLLSCHYDIIEWLEPCWVYDTATGKYSGRSLWQRPRFSLDIYKTDGCYWPAFEPHHYLKLPRMVAATYYVGAVEGRPVCHLATSPRLEVGATRACRLVVLPEWQGAGVGTRFLNWVCQHEASGGTRWGDRVKAVYFHTSHPGLCSALRRMKQWRQVSCRLYGGNKKKSAASIRRSSGGKCKIGYGGHFRAVQGFKYVGESKGGL
jgi:GNAT superfamily N-acetyltransferase